MRDIGLRSIKAPIVAAAFVSFLQSARKSNASSSTSGYQTAVKDVCAMQGNPEMQSFMNVASKKTAAWGRWVKGWRTLTRLLYRIVPSFCLAVIAFNLHENLFHAVNPNRIQSATLTVVKLNTQHK